MDSHPPPPPSGCMSIPDSNVMEGHRWPTTECHRLPVVAHHTYVQLIAGGPLATLFEGGGPPVVHQWPSAANPTLRLPPACHQWLLCRIVISEQALELFHPPHIITSVVTESCPVCVRSQSGLDHGHSYECISYNFLL